MRDGKYVILCIDDDEDIREAMQMILEKEGYLVTLATSAEEGLRKFKAEQPDFIFVDLMMEEIDAGTNFAKEMKAADNTAPIYMLSSVGDSLSVTTDYAALGLSGVLQKPISPEQLLTLLRTKLHD